MGRYSRRTEHIRRAPGDDTPLCGTKQDRWPQFTGWAESPHACPKCQARHFAALIAAEFPTAELAKGENVRDADRTWKEYRGVHALSVAGELRAFICSENGWGAGYTVHRAENVEHAGGRVEICRYDGELITAPADGSEFGRDKTCKNFGSKEQAAYALLKYNLRDFPPPKEPGAFMEAVEADAAARRQRDLDQSRHALACHNERETTVTAEREELLRHVEALRGINAENSAAVEALRAAISLIEQKIAECDQAIANAQRYRAKISAEINEKEARL